MNVWNFTGNIGRDAEQRFTTDGTSAVSFSVAVKAGFGDKAVTTWAKCTLWGKRGESVLPYLVKGTLVGVSGEAALKEFTAKDGSKGANLEVRVNDVTLFGGKRESTDDDQRPAKPANSPTPAKQAPAKSFDDFDDDIPF